jgi:hypothetical protein
MMNIPNELSGLSRVSLNDQGAFVSATTEANLKSWLYYFPFLYCFSLSNNQTLLWESHDGAICLYFLRRHDDKYRLDLYLPPFPFSPAAMKHVLERIASFNGARFCRILWADEQLKTPLESEGFRTRPIEQEYVYDTEQVRSLSGKNFHRLRRNLNRVKKIPNLELRGYRPTDEEPCRELLRRWRRFLRDEKDVEVSGYYYSERCLDHALSFQGDILRGEVITVDNRVCGFAFAGRISASYGSLFLAISDHDVAGLGYLQRFSLIVNSQGIPYFNDSSDTGRAGLAEVKKSFNPVEIHNLYRAHLPEPALSRGPDRRAWSAVANATDGASSVPPSPPSSAERRLEASTPAQSPGSSGLSIMPSSEEIATLVREAIYRDLASYRAAELALTNPTVHASVLVKPRSRGRRLDRLWVNGRGGMATLLEALQVMQGPARRYARQMDVIEIGIAHSFQRLAPEAAIDDLPRRLTGVKGLLLRAGDLVVGVAPSEMIAANRGLSASRDRLLEENGLSEADLRSGRAELYLFDAFTVLVHLGPPARAALLYRGSTVVLPSAISQAETQRTADDMSTWMLRQVNDQGRMVYKYLPSRGRESDGDNTIRQMMATICLNRIAQRTGRAEDREIADRNLAHNVAKYVRAENGIGVAIEGEKVKLGGMALAALAIHENPGGKRFSTQFDQLCAGIDLLWQPDGSFKTFLRPAERNDNQNFYPGETLLLWASRLDAAPDADLRERFLKSFAYYRGFFEANPNPAFVPWHTQAYCLALRKLDNRELVEFVFRINDWLLPMQQWDGAPAPDLKGRFYNPEHPEYGPPHASSTGVYLEGLIDAFVLARRLGETARAERYRIAIARGIRSLRQLQFRSDDDMFYVSKRERVFGGIRTEMYDNIIRCDNVQHGLMGILKILQEFTEPDYLLSPADQGQAAAAQATPLVAGGPASA